MPGLAAVSHLVLVLEDDDLLALALLDDFAEGLRALDGGVAEPGLVVVAGEHQHAAELDLISNLAVEPLDLDDVSRLDLVLLPTRLEDRVHHGHPCFCASFVRTRGSRDVRRGSRSVPDPDGILPATRVPAGASSRSTSASRYALARDLYRESRRGGCRARGGRQVYRHRVASWRDAMRFTSDEEGAPSGRNVLIVDDDRDIGDLVSAILTDEG